MKTLSGAIFLVTEHILMEKEHSVTCAHVRHVFLFSSSRPPWFDLPPPPYLPDGEEASEGDLPHYESPSPSLAVRTTSSNSQSSSNFRQLADQL